MSELIINFIRSTPAGVPLSEVIDALTAITGASTEEVIKLLRDMRSK